MNLLSVTNTLDPAWGGPVELLRSIASALVQAGHEFHIITMDDARAPWLANYICSVTALGPSKGRYAYNAKLIPHLQQIVSKYDAVIAHGLWTFPTTAASEAISGTNVPLFIYAHGDCSPYYLRPWSATSWKKRLYYKFKIAPVLARAKGLLFISEEEYRQSFESYKPSIGARLLTRYGISPPSFDRAFYTGNMTRTALGLNEYQILSYVGRLHPGKGLDLLIKAVAALPDKSNLKIVIAGPATGAYDKELQHLARRLQVDSHFLWVGPVWGDDKWSLYNDSDAFILPSHMENFGIVLFEAMSQRCPVLLTNRVNTYREIDNAQAGLVEEDSVDGITRLLRRFANLSMADRTQMGQNGHDLVNRHFLIDHAIQDVISLVSQQTDAAISSRL